MKKLYQWNVDFGRMGSLDSVFIVDDAFVNKVLDMGLCVSFGEILGKHSDIYCDMKPEQFEVLSENQDVITELEKIFAKSTHGYEFYSAELSELNEFNKQVTTISGKNPLNYLELDW